MITRLGAVLALVTAASAAHADRRAREVVRAPLGAPAGWTARAGWLVGSFAAPGADRDPVAAERAARRMIEVLGLDPADWVATADRVDGGTRTVAFRQTYRGAPVVDGALAFAIARDRIFAIADHAYTGIAVADVRAGDVVLATDGRYVAARAIAEPSRTRYVDARTGAPLATRERTRHATGTLLYDVPDRYPGGARTARPAPFANVTGDGAPLTTDVAGLLAWSTSAPLAVAPSTTGPYVAVTSALGPSTAALTLADGGTATWSAPTVEATDAELAAFVHVALGKQAARRFMPMLASWLDTPLAVSVNAADTSCNAFTDDDGLHFYQATATCENTGRLTDVVYHELGHAIHGRAAELGLGGFPDLPLGEGLADFNAANLLADSALGRGFHFTNEPLRDIDPPGRDLRWPTDTHPAADAHATGLIVSGALWDLRTLADPPTAETAFRGVLLRAADIPASYTAALVEDDDDGDLANGTPHACAIGEAFARHGLAPDFATTTVGTPAIAGLAIAIPIVPATNAACPPPTITSATLHYRREGEPTVTDVALAVSPTQITGAIPPQPDPTTVRFSIDLALSNGLSIALPSNLADPEYTAFAGTVTPLYCARMDVDPGWTTTGDGWQYANPPTSPFPDPAGETTGAYGTNLAGDGLYAANATTTATLPPVDTTGFARVHLQFQRWLTVEDAAYDRATISADGATLWTNANGGGTLDHADREWRFQDVDLTPALADGVPVSVAFGLATDGLGNLGGWTLRDVCVVGLGPGCGDGVVELDRGEECDDGNRASGDGCDATCRAELPAAPPPGCCAVDAAPPALPLGLLVLVSAARRAAAGRGRDRSGRRRSRRPRTP